MFNRRSDTADVAAQIGDNLKMADGTIMVVAKDGVVLGIRLEPTPQPEPTPYSPIPDQVFGPADTLASIVGDVLRHVTGTPEPEPDPEGSDEARYVPVSQDPDTYWASLRGAQRDLLMVIQDQLDDWRREGVSGEVVSHAGVKAFLDAQRRKLDAGEYLERGPF